MVSTFEASTLEIGLISFLKARNDRYLNVNAICVRKLYIGKG